jgi:hypothetical protein
MGDAADLIDDVLETVFTFFSPLLRGERNSSLKNLIRENLW